MCPATFAFLESGYGASSSFVGMDGGVAGVSAAGFGGPAQSVSSQVGGGGLPAPPRPPPAPPRPAAPIPPSPGGVSITTLDSTRPFVLGVHASGFTITCP